MKYMYWYWLYFFKSIVNNTGFSPG